MKTPLRLLLAAAVCAAALPTQAQTPSSTPAPEQGAKPEGKRWGNRYDRMTESLPEDMRDRFRQIRDETLQDPKIAELKVKAEAAGKEFRDAMRETMEARDPELAEKVRAHFESRWGRNGNRKPNAKKNEPGAPTPAPLQPEQRDRIERAREIAMQAPAVQSARAKMQTAQTPEARMEAGEEFREAMRAAMLTADPSLVDVIDRMPIKKRVAGSDAKPEQP